MATIDEVKVKGRAYRVYDEVNNIWKRISYWTAASDVEFEDEMNLEDKITEITTNFNNDLDALSDNLDSSSEDLQQAITDLSNNTTQNFVQKSQLTFTLNGSDLYITKTY